MGRGRAGALRDRRSMATLRWKIASLMAHRSPIFVGLTLGDSPETRVNALVATK